MHTLISKQAEHIISCLEEGGIKAKAVLDTCKNCHIERIIVHFVNSPFTITPTGTR